LYRTGEAISRRMVMARQRLGREAGSQSETVSRSSSAGREGCWADGCSVSIAPSTAYDGLLSQLCADAGRWKSTYRAWVILMSILSREEKLIVEGSLRSSSFLLNDFNPLLPGIYRLLRSPSTRESPSSDARTHSFPHQHSHTLYRPTTAA
jgi:hypothetical protein